MQCFRWNVGAASFYVLFPISWLVDITVVSTSLEIVSCSVNVNCLNFYSGYITVPITPLKVDTHQDKGRGMQICKVHTSDFKQFFDQVDEVPVTISDFVVFPWMCLIFRKLFRTGVNKIVVVKNKCGDWEVLLLKMDHRLLHLSVYNQRQKRRWSGGQFAGRLPRLAEVLMWRHPPSNTFLIGQSSSVHLFTAGNFNARVKEEASAFFIPLTSRGFQKIIRLANSLAVREDLQSWEFTGCDWRAVDTSSH